MVYSVGREKAFFRDLQRTKVKNRLCIFSVSLISAFVIHILESIMFRLAESEKSIFLLAS